MPHAHLDLPGSAGVIEARIDGADHFFHGQNDALADAIATALAKA